MEVVCLVLWNKYIDGRISRPALHTHELHFTVVVCMCMPVCSQEHRVVNTRTYSHSLTGSPPARNTLT